MIPFLEQLKSSMATVRLAKSRGLHVSYKKVVPDVLRLSWEIVCLGFKLFGVWNPLREGWRTLSNNWR